MAALRTLLICLVLGACSRTGGDVIYPYEASVTVTPKESGRADVMDLATEAVRKLGYISDPAARTQFAIGAGRTRLGALQQPNVVSSYIFIDREDASGDMVISALRWCIEDCQRDLNAVVNAVSEEVSRGIADGQGHIDEAMPAQ